MADLYEHVLKQLYSRTQAGPKLGLDNMRKLLAALGSPEKGLACILVTGTNGKGSTCKMLAAALMTSKYQIGLYTSPHLLQFSERIQIANQQISKKAVIKFYKEITTAEKRAHVQATFFECATAMAFLAFKAAKVDFAILETGLGGRLDATNVIPKLVNILTPIGLDHTDILGKSLTAIAYEKAATIHKKGTVILAKQPRAAKKVILQLAKQQQAKVFAVTRYPLPHLLREASSDSQIQTLLSKKSVYQQENFHTVALALWALQQQGHLSLDLSLAFTAALRTNWPGRYQLCRATSKRPATLLDGAHNPAGLKALFTSLKKDPELGQRTLSVIFSALRTKDVNQMLKFLERLPASFTIKGLYLAPNSSGRSLTLPQLQKLAASVSLPTQILPHFKAAYKAALQDLSPPNFKNHLVVVTGSLFFIADALAALKRQPREKALDG